MNRMIQNPIIIKEMEGVPVLCTSGTCVPSGFSYLTLYDSPKRPIGKSERGPKAPSVGSIQVWGPEGFPSPLQEREGGWPQATRTFLFCEIPTNSEINIARSVSNYLGLMPIKQNLFCKSSFLLLQSINLPYIMIPRS